MSPLRIPRADWLPEAPICLALVHRHLSATDSSAFALQSRRSRPIRRRTAPSFRRSSLPPCPRSTCISIAPPATPPAAAPGLSNSAFRGRTADPRLLSCLSANENAHSWADHESEFVADYV